MANTIYTWRTEPTEVTEYYQNCKSVMVRFEKHYDYKGKTITQIFFLEDGSVKNFTYEWDGVSPN